jgi:NTP pyrophosphatase (non-canonical NTP hydrolase)
MNVIKFASIMQEKLDDNDHKDHWSGCTMQYLFTRLSQETGELSRANKKKLHPDIIDREAADVANFAMMIADNYRENFEDTE